MADAQSILVENFRESLRQFQQHITLGLGGAFAFAVLMVSAPPEGPTFTSVFGLRLTIPVAVAVALAAYWIGGALGSFSLERAALVIARIEDDELRRAVITYPSLATARRGYQFLAAVVPAVLVVIGLARWIWTQPTPDMHYGSASIAAVVLLAPYLTLVVQLFQYPVPETPLRVGRS